MKYLPVLILTMMCSCVFSTHIVAQDAEAIFDVSPFNENILKQINAYVERLNNKLLRQANNQLSAMLKKEDKMKKKLSAIDSSAASTMFDDVERQYNLLQQRINIGNNKKAANAIQYIPRLDTLQTALLYFNRASAIIKSDPNTAALLQKALTNTKELQSKFSQTEDIARFISQRRKFLNEKLGAFGFAKELKQLQKQVYYYQAQVEAYKRDLNDPSGLEAKALSVLKNSKRFKNFFREHSQLAALFKLPGASSSKPLAEFASLQTRESVDQLLLQRFGSLPDFQNTATRQIVNGQSQLNELKNKLNESVNHKGSSDQELADFKPNDQKTKSFFKRVELGANLQTTKSNAFFPSTSDLALSLGYKINDKSTAGIGGAYKMGWGRDIRHVSISHQGIGLRSFVDLKLKGNFWISGGAEMNYRSQFSNFEILDDFSPWQKSALLVISKKYRVSRKVKGNMQLMYDFLSSQQVPKTQPVIFRIGYVW